MHNFICTQTLCINFRSVCANCRRKVPDKIVSTDRRLDRQTDMKIAYAQLHIQLLYTQTLCVNFRAVLAKRRSNDLDNNDLVKFTSSRGDNSATNDNMVMKIAHAELYTTSNIVCNFEFSTCNTVELFL